MACDPYKNGHLQASVAAGLYFIRAFKSTRADRPARIGYELYWGSGNDLCHTRADLRFEIARRSDGRLQRPQQERPTASEIDG